MILLKEADFRRFLNADLKSVCDLNQPAAAKRLEAAGRQEAAQFVSSFTSWSVFKRLNKEETDCMKHGGGSIIMWDREPRADGSILEENLLESAEVWGQSSSSSRRNSLIIPPDVLGLDQSRFMSRSEFNRKSKTWKLTFRNRPGIVSFHQIFLCYKERTFLRLVFLRFALIVEADRALVDPIRLNAVPPAEPRGVVCTVQGSEVRGQGEAKDFLPAQRHVKLLLSC